MIGLSQTTPRFRRRVIALYALIATLALALPALATRPRALPAHPLEQEVAR